MACTYHREDDVRDDGVVLICRESIWRLAVAGAFFLGLGTAMLGGAAKGLPAQVYWPAMVLLVCMPPCIVPPVIAALRHENWVLRATPSGMWLKLRSYRNRRLSPDDRVVVHIPFADISGIRRTRETLRFVWVAGARGRRRPRVTRETTTHLDVILPAHETEGLRQELLAELRRAPPPTWALASTTRHMPVRVPEPGCVRIPVLGPETRLRPALDEVLATLQELLPVRNEQHLEGKRTDELDADGHAELIRQLAEAGRWMPAIVLIRQRDGGDFTTARARLEALIGLGREPVRQP